MVVVPFINKDLSQLTKSWYDMVEEPNIQRRFILIIVCVALLLDNMLYMVIVPIIPDYLRYIGAWDTHTVVNHDGSYGSLGAWNITYFNQTLENGTIINSTMISRRRYRPFGSVRVVYDGEDSLVGVLFASKAIVQLFVNPFSGALIDKIGYEFPMSIGLMVIFFSTAIFACGQSFGVLLFARSLQGVGSAFADTAGMAMLADRYTVESERSKALGIALAFISFGSLIGPPFGGFLYEFAGKGVPFIILSLVALFDGIMLLLVVRPKSVSIKKKDVNAPKGTPIWRLLMDPYIAVTAGCLVMANVSLAFLEPTISLWMEENLDVKEWQMGIIWLPSFLPHVLGVYVTVKLSARYRSYQWLVAAVGLVLEGISCFMLPFSKTFSECMVPLCILCFGIALVDTSLLPMLGYLVDVRHVSIYGSVYAIADISYSIAYAIGPIIAGGIVESIGFFALNVGLCVSTIMYAPVMYALKKIYDYAPFQNEANVLMADPPPYEYETYMMTDCQSTKPRALSEEEQTGNHLNYGDLGKTNGHQVDDMNFDNHQKSNVHFAAPPVTQQQETAPPAGQCNATNQIVTRRHIPSKTHCPRSNDMQHIISSEDDDY